MAQLKKDRHFLFVLLLLLISKPAYYLIVKLCVVSWPLNSAQMDNYYSIIIVFTFHFLN